MKINNMNRTKYASLVRLIISMENNINDTNINAKAIVDRQILPNPNIFSINLCLYEFLFMNVTFQNYYLIFMYWSYLLLKFMVVFSSSPLTGLKH
jgi:hypothetical protein